MAHDPTKVPPAQSAKGSAGLPADDLLEIYLDGELDAHARGEFEAAVLQDASLRDRMNLETSFRNELRQALAHGPAPAHLVGRIKDGLDKADVSAQPSPWARLRSVTLPVATGVVAMAAGVLFFAGPRLESPIGTRPEAAVAALAVGAGVEDTIRTHEKNLPVEVRSDAEMDQLFAGRVPVRVRAPVLPSQTCKGCSLLGGRLSNIQGQDAAMLRYSVGNSQLTVHVFDANRLFDSLAAGKPRELVGEDTLVVGSVRGYSVVLLRKAGVGYAFTSDLPQAELLALVKTSLVQ